MLALALTLAVAAIQPDPQPLQGAEQARALCEALVPSERLAGEGDVVSQARTATEHEGRREAALAQAYRVTVTGARLRFEAYDPQERRLTLSDRSLLLAAGGALLVWPAEERGLPVTVDLASAQRIVRAAPEGALTLVVTFHLPEDGDDATCAHPNGSSRYTLGVEPYAWEYLAAGQVVARGGAGGDRPLVTAAEGAVPSVEVSAPPVAGGDALRQAAEARRGDLEGCYRRALQRDPALDGNVVADLDLAAGGQPRSVRVAAESVQDDAMVSCVHDVLAATRFPSGSGRAQLPIEFSLRPPPGGPR